MNIEETQGDMGSHDGESNDDDKDGESVPTKSDETYSKKIVGNKTEGQSNNEKELILDTENGSSVTNRLRGLLPIVVHENVKDMILFNELESAEYPEPLQTASALNRDKHHLELVEFSADSILVPIIEEISSPMERLHELITHNCLHKEPAIMTNEVTILEKRKEMEDKEEEVNLSNI
ncbi:hypothetical protein RDI58_010672 [Solanum bulbocastanum]|uniref:Uncharacterized protein n=1 Tax=Solanum bulbocastanum TaxID=147425 RepID=A0AAN8YGZ7_SOLBU